jgi:hypothetical protein
MPTVPRRSARPLGMALTGRYNWRTRLQEWVIAAYEPTLIAEGRPTLPGFLREHGYHTACIGKWHLGWNWPGAQPSRMTDTRNGQAFLEWDFTKPIEGGPTDRGFDYYFGVDLPNLPPFTYIENDRVLVQPTEKFQPDRNEGVVLPVRFVGTPAAPNWRMQDILPEITRRAVKYIHDRKQEKQPFFLYFSLTSPHEPIVPSKNFQGKSGIAPIADFVMETDWSVVDRDHLSWEQAAWDDHIFDLLALPEGEALIENRACSRPICCLVPMVIPQRCIAAMQNGINDEGRWRGCKQRKKN